MPGNLFHRLNPFAKSVHLAVVYVEYDRKKDASSDKVFSLLQGYLSAIAKCQITYIRVDNRYEDMPVSRSASNVYLVGGDNSFREFSGWQRGLTTLDTIDCRYDLILITNEMFLKPGPSFLQDYATKQLLTKALSDHKIIGRIDTSFKDYQLFGYDVSSWLCTNCIFIPKKAAEALGGFALINDNIHEILPRDYDPSHLLTRRPLPQDSTSGEFCLELELDTPPGPGNEIRVRFGTSTDHKNSPAERYLRIAQLKAVMINGEPLPPQSFIRGIVPDELGNLQADESFLLALPAPDTSRSRLTITGRFDQNALHKKFNALPGVVVYNDAKLFLPDAPINKTYQRGLVEWLTERWHSRFEINHDTWGLFKTKAAAIFNEALLTAKFKELGYHPESYGETQYY